MFPAKTNVVICHRLSLAEGNEIVCCLTSIYIATLPVLFLLPMVHISLYEEIQDCCYAEPCGRLPSTCLLLAAWPSNASAFQVLWSLLSSKFRSALLHCRSFLFLVSLTVSIYYPNSHLLPHSRSCGRVVFARWWLALPCMLHQCVCLSIHASPTKLASGSKSGHACLQAELPVS